jgi:hypothetical protein
MHEIAVSLNLKLSDSEVEKIEMYRSVMAIIGKPLSFQEALSKILEVGLDHEFTVFEIGCSLARLKDKKSCVET